jgi:hypothetical protein
MNRAKLVKYLEDMIDACEQAAEHDPELAEHFRSKADAYAEVLDYVNHQENV